MEKQDNLSHLKEYLEALLRHAPSKSTCHLHIFKEAVGYLCKLTIHSNIRTFSSHNKDETIKSAVKATLREVKSQIAFWKKNRSSMELTGVTSVTGLHLNLLDQVETKVEEDLMEYKKSA